MTTTFADLVQFSATAAGAGAAGISTDLYATGAAVGRVGPAGTGVTMGVTSGGVTYSALYTNSAGAGAVVAPLGVIRRLQATAAGVGAARQGVGVVSTLPALSGLASNRIYGGASVVLPALSGLSSDPLPVPNIASAAGVLPSMVGMATGLTGEVGSASVTLPALTALASDRPYGGVHLSRLPALLGLSNDAQTVLGLAAREYVFYRDTTLASLRMGTRIADQITTTDTVAIANVLSLLIAEAIETENSTVASSVYSVALSEIVSVLSAMIKSGDQIVWVTNAESGANWTYDSWSFASLVEWNGKYFGAGPTGLYELSGDTDDGEPIEASILTGKSDLGTVQHKRMPYVYVGASSDNGLQLLVHTDNGETNTYTVTAAELMGNSRTAIGKGLRSKYWQFEITNVDGGDFELESFEMRPDATIRRI